MGPDDGCGMPDNDQVRVSEDRGSKMTKPLRYIMGANDGCGTPEDVRQDNHIHVELDFVPVTERLPDPASHVCFIDIAGNWHRGFVNLKYDNPRWCSETTGSLWGYNQVIRWAEIPQVSDAR